MAEGDVACSHGIPMNFGVVNNFFVVIGGPVSAFPRRKLHEATYQHGRKARSSICRLSLKGTDSLPTDFFRASTCIWCVRPFELDPRSYAIISALRLLLLHSEQGSYKGRMLTRINPHHDIMLANRYGKRLGTFKPTRRKTLHPYLWWDIEGDF